LSANPHWSPLPPDYSFSAPPHPRPEEREKFLCADLRPETPVPLGAASWNVREVKLTFHPEANPFETETNRGAKWQDDRHPALWDRAKQRAKEASGSGYSVALVVVGHTHNPRIILGRYPDGERIAMRETAADGSGPATWRPASTGRSTIAASPFGSAPTCGSTNWGKRRTTGPSDEAALPRIESHRATHPAW
jgi:hypothetical protein